MIATVVFGRAWCGWICPLGTTLDIFTGETCHRTRKKAREFCLKNFVVSKFCFLSGILLAALFGNLSLLIFDPLTIFYRSITASLWPALDWVFTSAEKSLFQFPFLASPINTLETWLRPAVFPYNPLYYRQSLAIFFFLVGIVALNLIVPRFWCRYICPLGALLGLISKFAIFRRQVNSECKGCVFAKEPVQPARLTRHAITPAIPPNAPCAWIACRLVPVIRSASRRKSPTLSWREYDPKRREFLVTFGLTAMSLVVLKKPGTQLLVRDRI